MTKKPLRLAHRAVVAGLCTALVCAGTPTGAFAEAAGVGEVPVAETGNGGSAGGSGSDRQGAAAGTQDVQDPQAAPEADEGGAAESDGSAARNGAQGEGSDAGVPMTFSADGETEAGAVKLTAADGTESAYDTLLAALKAAGDGAVITLQDDAAYGSSNNYTIQTSVTIDLNGHTLSLGGSSLTPTKSKSRTTVIKNGTITGSVDGGASAAITATGFGTLEMRDVTIVNTRRGAALRVDSSKMASVTLSNCSFKNTCDGETAYCTALTVTGSSSTNACAFSATNCTFTAQGAGTATVTLTAGAASSLSFDGCTIEATGTSNGSTAARALACAALKAGSVSITNTKITASGNDAIWTNNSCTATVSLGEGNEVTGRVYLDNSKSGDGCKLDITGGTFTNGDDPVFTYTKVPNESTGYASLLTVEGDATFNGAAYSEAAVAYDGAAVVDGVTYDTVSEAIEAARSGSTVTLLNDVTEDVTVPASATVTLDLAGCKLTNVSGHTITNNGTLTITDSSAAKSGKVDNVSHGRAAVYNNAGATAMLSGGSFTRSKENGTSSTESGGNSYYTLKNFGTMTVNEGVTVSQGPNGKGQYSSLVANGWQNGANADKENGGGNEPAKVGNGATLTINGGTFTGGLNTIKNDDYGTLDIKGGAFTNVAQAAVLNWNVAAISGGTFDSGVNAVLNGRLDDTMDQGRLTITGCTFSAPAVIGRMGGSAGIGEVGISGGTFNAASDGIIFESNDAAASGANSVSITGGTFNGELVKSGNTYTVSATGGTYSQFVPAAARAESFENFWTEDGFTLEQDSELGSSPSVSLGKDGTGEKIYFATQRAADEYAETHDLSGETPQAYVASVTVDGTTTKYTSLTDALAEIRGGATATITLMADVACDVTIPKGATVTFDLAGHALSGASGHTITNEGALTLKDSVGDGVVSNGVKGRGALLNVPGATAEVTGGTLTGSTWYVVKNLGTLTLSDSASVVQEDAGSSAIANGWVSAGSATGASDLGYAYNGIPATLTITGGTYSGGMNVVKNDDAGVLAISGGDFSNTAGPILLNWNEATVSGGAFTGTSGYSLLANGYLDDSVDKGRLTVTGGTFMASGNGAGELFGYGEGSERGGSLVIEGGTFKGSLSGVPGRPGEGDEALPYGVAVSAGTFTQPVPAQSRARSRVNLVERPGLFEVVAKDEAAGKALVSVTVNGDAVYFMTVAAAESFSRENGGAEVEQLVFTVTFDANGGSAVAAQTVRKGDTATAPADPVREGYTFAGWYADEALTRAYDFGADVSADVTLFAKWERVAEPAAKHTVTFVDRFNGTNTKVEVVAGASVPRPADPSFKGWEFKGWFSDEAATRLYDFSDPVTGDLTLYAGYAKAGSQEIGTAAPSATNDRTNDGTKDGALPQTGDASGAPVAAAAAAGMAAVTAGAAVAKRRRRE